MLQRQAPQGGGIGLMVENGKNIGCLSLATSPLPANADRAVMEGMVNALKPIKRHALEQAPPACPVLDEKTATATPMTGVITTKPISQPKKNMA